MRIRIESDGTPHGTKAIDVDTGKKLEGITRIEFDPIDAKKQTLVKAKIFAYPVHLSVVVDGKVIRTHEMHEAIKIGRFRLYHHDYDGPVYVLIDEEASPTKGAKRGAAIPEKALEAALKKLLTDYPAEEEA